MKKIIQKTLMLAAMMILVVFVASIWFSGFRAEILLVLELFFLAFFIVVIQYFFANYVMLSPIAATAGEYIAVSCVVLLFGYYVGWFFKSNWWMAFFYVGIIYVPAYFLDMVTVNKDIQYINNCIEQSRK